MYQERYANHNSFTYILKIKNKTKNQGCIRSLIANQDLFDKFIFLSVLICNIDWLNAGDSKISSDHIRYSISDFLSRNKGGYRHLLDLGNTKKQSNILTFETINVNRDQYTPEFNKIIDNFYEKSVNQNYSDVELYFTSAASFEYYYNLDHCVY